MKYIHYGHKRLCLDKFNPITNEMVVTKPHGGLWASRVDAEYGWKKWCEENDYKCDLDTFFTFSLKKDAKVLTITSTKQLESLPTKNDNILTRKIWTTLDFEKLSTEYDAIEVLISKDFKLYYELYGWDCDSILIMNPEIIIEEK